MDVDLVINDGFLVMPETGIHRASLAIKDEKIVGIFEDASFLNGQFTIEARGKYVLPGVIQPHAHLGRLVNFEDDATETSSAAIGGVTTILIFHRENEDYNPLFQNRIRTAEQKSFIDFSFHLQIMTDLHLEGIPQYFGKYGISSFKFNMGYKGLESIKKGITELNDGLMVAAFSRLKEIKGTVACVHAENSEINSYQTERLQQRGRNDLKAWSQSRPFYSEAEAIQRALFFSELSGCPLYIVHMTTRQGLKLISKYRQRGRSPVFVETCPQYLTHDVDCGLGNIAKFIPPLRTAADRAALWQGLKNGDIDTIGIDQVTRSVDPPESSIWERNTSPREAVSVLPMLITEGLLKRGLSLEQIVKVTSYNAARIFNLYPQKGTIRIGSDADIAVVDMDIEKKITPEVIQSSSNFSVYEGWTLKGWPIWTVCRGKVIMRNGKIVGQKGYGTFIKRNKTV